MDLLQAEAVADLIDAETAQAAHNAVGQLEGALSRTVTEIYDGLMAIVSRFYAVVDYPDEGGGPGPTSCPRRSAWTRRTSWQSWGAGGCR